MSAGHEAFLRALAGRAATLAERIEGRVALAPADPATTARRLAAWSDAVAKGDDAVFAARLALDGLDRDGAALVVGDARLPDAVPLPGWAVLVGEALALARWDDGADPARDPDDPIPAEALALPFVRAARARRDRAAPPTGLAGAALLAEDRHLLRTLGELLEILWDRELAIMRDRELGSLGEHVLRAQGATGRERHDALARQLLGDLPALLDRHPALARQLGTACVDWVGATRELHERLAADRGRIAARFAGGVDPGVVAEEEWGRSDPHNGGRTVVLLRFGSGLGLVYKPKGLGSEAGLARAVEWLSARGMEPRLASLAVLDRGSHGWVERVAHAPCPDEAAVERYYERAGALLALMRALDGSDCHNENLIAAGEHPHIVDGETVLQPALRELGRMEEPEGALELAGRSLGEGVLGVGLLPAWFARPGAAAAVDVSGLGRASEDATPVRRFEWELPGTDLARRVAVERTPAHGPNEAVLDGAPVRCEDHEDALVRGFTRAYRIILAGRDDLLGPHGPLVALADAPVRVVVRGTWLYAVALAGARAPERLGEGVERSFAFERLARPLLAARDPAGVWPVFRGECAALERGDVPHFATTAAARELPAAGAALPLRGSALDNAATQLGTLGPADLRRQVALIRAALAIRRRSADAPPARPAPAGDAPPLAGARHVGRLLLEHAVRGGDGGATWVGAHQNAATERFELRPAGFDLYEGVPGIALLLGALRRVDGDDWREPALAAVRTVAGPCDAYPAAAARALGIGGGGGVGGLALALTWCAALLDEPGLLDTARAVSAAIDPAAVASDERLDVMGGSAGLVLGMLALARATGDEVVLERARWGGDRLLATLAPAPEGGAAWRTLAGQPVLTGMAHGASGGALALARLAAATGEERYADGARAALRFERATRLPGRRGWGDRRAGATTETPLATWCYGVAGIGTARLGILACGALEDMAAELEEDLVVCAEAAAELPLARDHLCCGAAGAAELARALGPRCPEPLRRRAGDWARGIAGRLLAGAPPSYTGPPIGDVPYPGLYQGIAGIGYALLGTVAPDLPVPTNWE